MGILICQGQLRFGGISSTEKAVLIEAEDISGAVLYDCAVNPSIAPPTGLEI